MLTRDHFTGFLTGLGAAVLGFYYYRKNQSKVDAFLAGKGIHLPTEMGGVGPSPSGMNLEQLIEQKERLEDMIAEKETQSGQPALN